MRTLLTTGCLLCTSIVFAQEAKESVPPVAPGPGNNENHILYELEVSPADEPRPGMKYRLLPNPADLKPGNAATQYYKAFVLEADSPVRTKAYSKLRDWLDTPLHELDIDELTNTFRSIHEEAFYRSIRRATYRANCDWEESVEEEGIRVLLPAVSQLRSVGLLLTMKGRHEIALKDFDDAIQTARDNFTLCYHLQHDGGLVVHSLVGIAIVGVMHDSFFLDWIRAPASPNLYWALSEIPPYFDSRRFVARDLRMPEYTLPALTHLAERALTGDEAGELAKNAFIVGSRRHLDRDDVMRRAQLATWALQTYDESYRELREAGVSGELLDAMPALQVALLGRWNRYQRARDDLYKWSAVTYGADRDLALRKQNEIHQLARKTTVPFDAFLPPLRATFQAQLRQHRFLSVLRTIEALRLYAARHGKWPEALADVREVPVPDDPVTNAPFVYQASDNNATLIMVEHRLSSGLQYEYRLRLRDAEKSK